MVCKKQKKAKKSQEWKKKGGKLIPKTIVSEKDGTELFGFNAKPQGPNLMIMIDIYDEEKREETINRFRESCDELIEGYAKEGIFITCERCPRPLVSSHGSPLIGSLRSPISGRGLLR